MRIYLKNITSTFAEEVKNLDEYEFDNFWKEYLVQFDYSGEGCERFLVLNEGGEQVALAELDLAADRDAFQGAYLLPPEGVPILEIQMLDVRNKFRRQGIGKLVVAELAQMFPDRKLLALSEEADDFWRSLGWEKISSTDDDDSLRRPMFIAQ